MKRKNNAKKSYIFYLRIYLALYLFFNIIMRISNIVQPSIFIVFAYILIVGGPAGFFLLREELSLTLFFDENANDEYIMKFKKNYYLLFYPIDKITNYELRRMVSRARSVIKFIALVMILYPVVGLIWFM